MSLGSVQKDFCKELRCKYPNGAYHCFVSVNNFMDSPSFTFLCLKERPEVNHLSIDRGNCGLQTTYKLVRCTAFVVKGIEFDVRSWGIGDAMNVGISEAICAIYS